MMVLLAPCVCKALKHKALETTEQRQKAGHAPSCEEALALCASVVSLRLSLWFLYVLSNHFQYICEVGYALYESYK